MSRRLDLLNAALRRTAKPMLARTATPEQSERDFRMGARFLPAPRDARLAARDIPGPTRPLRMTRVTCGPVAGDGAILYFHGGAYVAGSAWTHRGLLGRLSAAAGVAVEAPDYRLAQDALLPAARDDAMAAWEALAKRHRPERIVVAGDSAGGGLALGLLADLGARGTRPAGLVAFSPWTDLTLSGASHASNAEADPLLPAWRVAELWSR
jgi:epsilon-lactone hydrolase